MDICFTFFGALAAFSITAAVFLIIGALTMKWQYEEEQ